MRKLAHILAFLALGSTALPAQISYGTEIKSLSTNYDRTFFLQSAFEADQDVRKYEDSVMLATGWKSPEHLAAIDSLMLIDSILTAQMDAYLDWYSHPTKQKYGEIPRIAPWVVIHHSANEEVRLKHFSKFYEAYRQGDLEARRLLSLLERIHRRRFQEEHQFYGTDEEQIDALVKKLELLPLRSRLKLPFSK